MNRYAAQIEKIIAQAEEDGFQRGLKYARDALSAPRANGAVVSVKKKRKKTRKARKGLAKPGKTVETRVLECIDANPGKTGAEIIRLLGEINPRTARTMLRRLRMNGDIEKSGEGWFAKRK
jgi:hypothetical protein